MKKATYGILRAFLCVLAVAVFYWFDLPPLNPRSGAFWRFLFFSIVICSVIVGFSALLRLLTAQANASPRERAAIGKETLRSLTLPVKMVLFALAGIILFSLLMSLIGAQIFNASRYAALLDTVPGDFSAEVSELSMSQIPVVDRDTATRLGQRKLGEMSDLVSQFEIEDDYTQINYKNNPVRVTPLRYADFIKWCTNASEGIPAYISVNLTTQETQLVRLKDLGLDNIRYSRSEYLLRNLDRYLRFHYPTKIFDEVSFEIDENGTPYWVASVIQYRVGFWNGEDMQGAVLLNAVTGESRYYDVADIPRWVDQVYDESVLFEQLRYNGLLENGYWNSIFGQKGCVVPTDGYNYIALDDDVWMYTGITSVTADESNIGFVLVNLRTKEARYYSQAGAEEYSAMESARGQIQEKNYNATFPLLLNVGGRPTYFMSLKDGAGLVKMYAFVDMEQYQIVGTGTSVDKAREAYIALLKDGDIATPSGSTEEVRTVSGTITALASAVVDGNTRFYVRLSDSDDTFVLPAGLSDELPFIRVGDAVTVTLTGSAVTAVTFEK